MQIGQTGRTDRLDRKLDQAARAAWLYYVAGNTQDEIAGKLGVSRQVAQRLVALAVSEKLIKFRVDHPLADCMALAERLRRRFDLAFTEVVPSDPSVDGLVAGLAAAAAAWLEALVAQPAPLVIAFTTGRTLRAVVDEVAPQQCPQHRIVSLIGAITRDGRASPYEVVRRFAERIGAACYPLPGPVIASTIEECAFLRSQRHYLNVHELASAADATIVGIGEIAWDAPLHRDGFLTDQELAELIDLGAVGEIGGHAFDATGQLVTGGTNERLAGLPLPQASERPMIAVGCGRRKTVAIRGALRSRMISGLITDESTAAAVLAAG